MFLVKSFIILPFLFPLSSFSYQDYNLLKREASKNAITNTSIECTNPRPEICTREYMPVCGTRDTGVRCFTTPCPSTELKTYSNKCDACSDKKVLSYTPEKCK